VFGRLERSRGKKGMREIAREGERSEVWEKERKE